MSRRSRNHAHGRMGSAACPTGSDGARRPLAAAIARSDGPSSSPIRPEVRTPYRGQAAAVCLLLAAGILAVFWPVTGFDFINLDDPGYFSANPRVLSGLGWNGVLWAFRTTYLGNWHPLTWMSFMLDATLFGPGPGGPHLVNLLLHAANGALVFLLLRRMTGALWRSAIVSALFALHPLRAESVAWVTERKDVLSGLFLLLTLWAYVRYAEHRTAGPWDHGTTSLSHPATRIQHPVSHSPARPPVRSALWYLASLLFFAFGLMSKPMLVTVPFLLLLLDLWPLKRLPEIQGLKLKGQGSKFVRLLGEKTPFFLLSGIFCGVTFHAQSQAGALADPASWPLAARFENAMVSYARYLGKTLWPVDLAVFYPRPLHWPWVTVATATLLAASLFLAAVFCGRRRPYLVTGWLWWFGMLLPVIGVVQAGEQAMADRYTYLPALGLLMGLVWGSADLASRARLPRVVASVGMIALLACVGLRTADQLRYWRDSEALFRHALACTPDNVLARYSLGMALVRKGQWAEGMAQYQQALAIQPGALWPRNNLAWALATCPQAAFRNGAQAVELAKEVDRLSGGANPDLLDTLAAAYAEAGNFPEAIRTAERALVLAAAQANPHLQEFRLRLELYQNGSAYHQTVNP